MDYYKKLQERLDAHPAGAPAHEAFFEILRILFSPEEAEVASYLTFVLQPLTRIAEKTGKGEEELYLLLEGLADRGVVMAKKSEDGEPRYALLPTIPGLFEFPFMRAERAPQKDRLAELWHRYHTEALGNAFAASPTPQMRVIPVKKALPVITEVLPYDLVAEMIDRAKYIAVTNCACRVSMGLCDKPLEVCLAFETGARFLVERDRARPISKEEALKILDMSEEAGLVHCISNSKDRPAVLCNCCGCCCTILRGITELDNPNAVAKSRYVVSFDPSACTGCFLCLEDRCPVKAVKEKEDIVEVEESRCIGCGLCVSVCPTEALRLKKREEFIDTPSSFQELMNRVLVEKGKLEAYVKLNSE